ncbi:MAG TPA: class I SAM-dependent methyltransferase [Solirubrobacteraceae bacterium]|jgi:SAM-dependent methyltransferase|nr:class I SAM-dependent methyltransferase [Solirubrobacteraceae bacterium]
MTSETRPRNVRARYTTADLGVLTQAEARRFLASGTGDPRTDATLAWELLYRLEPELYDRLVSAERLHPGVIGWLPENLERIVEVAAGTGRLTLELVDRAREVVAIEPAAPLREILNRKLAAADGEHRVHVTHGFFDELPVADDCADVVVACSALTPAPGHGGEAGLAEMERVCRPGGRVVIVWPNDVRWLAAHGYRYLRFDGEMFVEFASDEEAAELIEIFYPSAIGEVCRHGWRRVPYDLLGTNPPRDLAFKVIAR